MLIVDLVDIDITFGNTYKLVKAKNKNSIFENKHRWTAFVRLEKKHQ